ncbi:MAG: ATP-binding cassette domain-containing protein [Aliishimia sp.]
MTVVPPLIEAQDTKPLDPTEPSFAVFMQMATLRREAVDPVALRAALQDCARPDGVDILSAIQRNLGVPKAKWHSRADPARCPLFMHDGENWHVLVGQTPENEWVIVSFDFETRTLKEVRSASLPAGARFAVQRLLAPFSVRTSPTLRLITSEIFADKRVIFEIIAASLALGVLAMAISFFSMQVYDRVIPTKAHSTLLVLVLGVCGAIILELIGKWGRANFLHHMTDAVDQRLARSTYARFLGIRLDQLPASVGSAAQKLRGYESVRAFLVGISTALVIDTPVALMLLGVLFLIGGPLAFIPAGFFVVGMLFGLFSRRRLENYARQATDGQQRKTGLLVEAIEGAEMIKSGNGGWRMMSRWLDVTDEARKSEADARNVSEHAQFLLAAMQQGSYALLIATGAVMAGTGQVTMGGLLACSILSGRIMSPLAVLPQQLVQWGNTKAAVEDLDRLWALAQDHEKGRKPILLDHIRGEYELDDVDYRLGDTSVLSIPELRVNAGERVAIIGSIGSGKTTLLHVLSGMYLPSQGRVLLDGVDATAISKPSLASQLAFVPQDGRLFSGSLRENLILGMDDPGDAQLVTITKLTGLFQTVIAPHPKGLDREIFEGGTGLSGGQRQLVHLTRAFLRQPRVWLLDEPTASMDQMLEAHVLRALTHALEQDPRPSFILVTHKLQLMRLVDRVIVLNNGKIQLDGPRDEVLKTLQSPPAAATPKAQVVPSKCA